MALILACVIACSAKPDAVADGREDEQPREGRAPAGSPIDSSAMPADTQVRLAGEGAAPQFAAGVYELVLARGEPLFNDSLVAEQEVDSRLPWALIDDAATLRDSVDVIDRHLRSREWNPGPPEGLTGASTTSDSATAIRKMLADWSCVEWRSAATLELDRDGTFVTEVSLRSYCRGSMPAYSVRTLRDDPITLETCPAWEPPVASQVPHLTCRKGRWWEGMYPYRSVGDTLELGGDCDGRDTYVLRRPQTPGLTMAWSSDVKKLYEC